MSAKLIQFNSCDHVFGGKNITETISTDVDIVFNESYVTVGDLLEGAHIHATYDLRVLGNIKAEQITVNGSLLVDGDIEADSLICRGLFICSGTVKVSNIELGNYSVADALTGKELQAAGDLFVHTTIDTDTLLETNGLVVAGEGITGDGKFIAKAAIVNDYYEFNGESKCKIFDISTMHLPVRKDEQNQDDDKHILNDNNTNIETVVINFNEDLSSCINKWMSLEEGELISTIRSTASLLPDMHATDDIIDYIVELSYEREITNFRDYLYILYAKHVFPNNLSGYETLEPVLTDMFDAVTFKIDKMDFNARDIVDFARSIYILSKYHSELPISLEEGADKIFSSIGLRYSTAEQVWRKLNGQI
jgi:hypothetical protein